MLLSRPASLGAALVYGSISIFPLSLEGWPDGHPSDALENIYEAPQRFGRAMVAALRLCLCCVGVGFIVCPRRIHAGTRMASASRSDAAGRN